MDLVLRRRNGTDKNALSLLLLSFYHHAPVPVKPVSIPFPSFSFCLHFHLSLNCQGRWDTTDDFTTSFLHFFSLFSTAFWDFAISRPLHLLMLSSYPFFRLPCLLPSFTVPCKMVLAGSDEREICSYHFSLRLFYDGHEVFVWSNRLLELGTDFSLITRSFYEMRSILRLHLISWLVFFFAAMLWGSMIYKHTGRWMWQGSASAVSWNLTTLLRKNKEEKKKKKRQISCFSFSADNVSSPAFQTRFSISRFTHNETGFTLSCTPSPPPSTASLVQELKWPMAVEIALRDAGCMGRLRKLATVH